MYTHEPQDLIVYFFISKVKCRALQIYCTCSSTVFSSNFPVELFRDLQLFKITTMPGTNAKVARTYIFMQWPHFNLQTCSFEELCIHENAPTCNIHAQRSYKRRYGKLKYTSWKSMKGGEIPKFTHWEIIWVFFIRKNSQEPKHISYEDVTSFTFIIR